ncbi:MAG: tyrosine-type recombinase/integrase [Actinomycetota bacterium]|nr:tyrosine-type recombinase/integrase [Actinomycetota bacterium]
MPSSGRRGSVKQAENGTWYFVLDIPSEELDARGRPKRKQTRRRGFKTRREALAELTRVQTSLEQFTYVAPAQQTLAEFIVDTWLPAAKLTVKVTTWEGYRRALKLHVLTKPIAARTLQQVDGPSLNKLYAQLLAPKEQGGGGLGPTTVHQVATILHRIFKDAMRWQAVSRNPVDASDPPKRVAHPEMKTWTAAQLNTFLDTALGHRHAALWWLLGTTGMRRGEALGVKWGDIDFTRRELKIQRALVNVEGGRNWSTPKTKAGRRTIILDEETIAVLKSHKAKQNAEKLLMGEGYTDQDLVSAQIDGETVGGTRTTEAFGRLLRKAGLPHIRLHDLRHTYATLALEAGIHPRVVQEQLGHSHVSVTLGIYSHVDVKLHASAADLMAAQRRAAREAGESS